MRLIALLASVAVLGIGAVACSSSDNDGDGDKTPSSDMTATVPAAEGNGETTAVDVAEADFTLTLSETEVPAGTVKFDVTNDGPTVHEFVVIKTDLAADELPQMDDLVEEDVDGIEIVDEIEGIPVGEMKSLTVNLEPGHYALICNISTHYGLGMRSDFSVTGNAS